MGWHWTSRGKVGLVLCSPTLPETSQSTLCALLRASWGPCTSLWCWSALGVGGKRCEGGNVLKKHPQPCLEWSEEKQWLLNALHQGLFYKGTAKPRAVSESCSALGFLGDAQLPFSCSVSILLHREGRKIPFLICVFPRGVDIGGSHHLKAHTVSGRGNCIPLSRIDWNAQAYHTQWWSWKGLILF